MSFFSEELGALQKIPIRIGTPSPVERGSRVFGVPRASARGHSSAPMPCADCQNKKPSPTDLSGILSCQQRHRSRHLVLCSFSSIHPLHVFSHAASPVFAIARRKTFFCDPPRVRICRSSRTNPHLELIAMRHGQNRILAVTRRD